MIGKEAILYICDNSGARRVKVIGFIGSFCKKQATIGDFVVVALRRRHKKRQFITKNIYLTVIVTTKRNLRRDAGYFIKFAYNKGILLSEQGKVVGTRVFGPIALEMRQRRIVKLLSLAKSHI
jgi:large subunit ribosomal protein L14